MLTVLSFFNRDLFNASKDNIANAELNDTLKTKTKELALSKIVEGRLLIQVNKMKQDMEKSKDSYDSAQSKLTTIMESYQSLKTDCQRYEILKSAMKKVTQLLELGHYAIKSGHTAQSAKR